MKCKILLALVFVVFFVGCKRTQFETAKVPAPQGGPEYSVDANLNGSIAPKK